MEKTIARRTQILTNIEKPGFLLVKILFKKINSLQWKQQVNLTPERYHDECKKLNQMDFHDPDWFRNLTYNDQLPGGLIMGIRFLIFCSLKHPMGRAKIIKTINKKKLSGRYHHRRFGSKSRGKAQAIIIHFIAVIQSEVKE